MTYPTDTIVSSIEQFLYREARLLDERRLEEWLTLFTFDGVYWMPLARHTEPGPGAVGAVRHSCRARTAGVPAPAHAALRADPPSRTVHQVSNVEVTVEDDDTAAAYAVIVVHEVRPGDPGQVGLGRPRTISGRAHYTLARDGESGWLISKKQVELLSHDLPVLNLSFIF